MVVGESRKELLHWLNATLDLDYTKVEQCGTGAAYCQLMDSIYGGVPLSKVKFGLNLSDYDARANMKVLQAAFNRNNISKPIEVERLIKCRLQDNLELLQWFKRHWMENKNMNDQYDASARRKSGASAPGSRPASRRATMVLNTPGKSTVPERPSSRTASTSTVSRQSLNIPKRSTILAENRGGIDREEETAPQRRITSGLDATAKLVETTRELEQTRDELTEARILTESLETERNFYFNKLREIEILTQSIQDYYTKDDADARRVQVMTVLELVDQIQEILFMTEKGFEVQDMDTDLF